MRRVWLAGETFFPGTEKSDLFYDGLLTTREPAPMTFEAEEKLLQKLGRREHLIGQMFFNGIPYEQYRKIWEGIHEINQMQYNPGRMGKTWEQIHESCDEIWETVESNYREAIRMGLCIEERNLER